MNRSGISYGATVTYHVTSCWQSSTQSYFM